MSETFANLGLNLFFQIFLKEIAFLFRKQDSSLDNFYVFINITETSLGLPYGKEMDVFKYGTEIEGEGNSFLYLDCYLTEMKWKQKFLMINGIN